MPIFKDYAENGELLTSKEEPLNETNIERYLKENGADKVQIYLQALEDFNKELLSILYSQGEKILIPKSSSQIKEEGINFFDKNLQLLKFAKTLISTPNP